MTENLQRLNKTQLCWTDGKSAVLHVRGFSQAREQHTLMKTQSLCIVTLARFVCSSRRFQGAIILRNVGEYLTDDTTLTSQNNELPVARVSKPPKFHIFHTVGITSRRCTDRRRGICHTVLKEYYR